MILIIKINGTWRERSIDSKPPSCLKPTAAAMQAKIKIIITTESPTVSTLSLSRDTRENTLHRKSETAMARPLVYPSLVSTLLVPTVAEREKREQLLFPTYTSVPPAIHHTTLNSTDVYQRAREPSYTCLRYCLCSHKSSESRESLTTYVLVE